MKMNFFKTLRQPEIKIFNQSELKTNVKSSSIEIEKESEINYNCMAIKKVKMRNPSQHKIILQRPNENEIISTSSNFQNIMKRNKTCDYKKPLNQTNASSTKLSEESRNINPTFTTNNFFLTSNKFNYKNRPGQNNLINLLNRNQDEEEFVYLNKVLLFLLKAFDSSSNKKSKRRSNKRTKPTYFREIGNEIQFKFKY